MPYNSSVSFDSVVLIESLLADRATGTALFHSTIGPQCVAHGMPAELYQVPDKATFFGALKAAENLAIAGHSPILHFEMHGDETGLELLSGEMVAWAELSPWLTRINERTRVNLLVVAAACNGWLYGRHPTPDRPGASLGRHWSARLRKRG